MRHPCRHRTWKGRDRWEALPEAAREAALYASTVPFSCLHTCQRWGPDEEIAAPERCGPDRRCGEGGDERARVSSRPARRGASGRPGAR